MGTEIEAKILPLASRQVGREEFKVAVVQVSQDFGVDVVDGIAVAPPLAKVLQDR